MLRLARTRHGIRASLSGLFPAFSYGAPFAGFTVFVSGNGTTSGTPEAADWVVSGDPRLEATR